MAETEIEIDRLKNKVTIIEAFINKYASIHETILSIQTQVKGGKEFREAFDENVEKIVKTILSNSDNFKALQEIADDRIKTHMSNSEYQKQLKLLIAETIVNEINNNKSDVNDSIITIINTERIARERTLLIKAITLIYGSLGLLFGIYKFFSSSVG